MGTPSALLFANRPPLSLPRRRGVSLGHFNKHIEGINFHRSSNKSALTSSLWSKPHLFSNLPSLSFRRPTHLLHPLKCSASTNADSDFENPVLAAMENLSFEKVKTSLAKLTPIDICKACAVLAVVISVTKWTTNTLFNPFFWMYFSWSWMFWPWYVALAIGFYGIYCFRKYIQGTANTIDQVGLVTSVFAWLTLIPPAIFNGHLEGWPVVFFCVYQYMFYLNVSVRKRMYGDLYMRPHDPEWDVSVPKRYTVLFCVAVAIGHWLAAFEGPELIRVPGGWSNAGIWGLIMIAMFTHYHGTLYLAKYSEKVVVPMTVVIFGPFRWVRHPIYASTMLLFLSYFAALRAPISCLYIIAVCLLYYSQKAGLEEALLLEKFGPLYEDYMKTVRSRFIPFVY